ncbi:MAG: MFS transporter, partial [Beggiatoa sp. IS2]
MKPPDIVLLFSTRIIRLFAYGFLSVVLAFYLIEAGLSAQEMGLLFTATLIGDTFISLAMTTSADRIGRKRMLILGSLLMVLAGILFVLTHHFALLLIAAIIGVISPSGNEIGPFLSIEQAALSQLVPNEQRTHVFAWYNLVGSFATATGALAGGLLAQGLQNAGMTPLDSYRAVLLGYAASGVLLAILFTRLSNIVEVSPTASVLPAQHFLGLHESRSIVAKLSAVFALDAFAGGFIIQSVMVYWFHLRFGADIGLLGGIFFGANILAGLSALLASRIAARIGLINTMVFTHIPSNVLLILIPFMPNLTLAIILLLLRFSIGQMD